MSGPVFTTASDYKHSELPQENSHKTQQTVTLLLSSSERAELGNNVNCTKTNCQTTQISQNTVHHHKFTFHYRRPFVFATKYFLWSFTAREECCGNAERGRCTHSRRGTAGECESGVYRAPPSPHSARRPPPWYEPLIHNMIGGKNVTSC